MSKSKVKVRIKRTMVYIDCGIIYSLLWLRNAELRNEQKLSITATVTVTAFITVIVTARTKCYRYRF